MARNQMTPRRANPLQPLRCNPCSTRHRSTHPPCHFSERHSCPSYPPETQPAGSLDRDGAKSSRPASLRSAPGSSRCSRSCSSSPPCSSTSTPAASSSSSGSPSASHRPTRYPPAPPPPPSPSTSHCLPPPPRRRAAHAGRRARRGQVMRQQVALKEQRTAPVLCALVLFLAAQNAAAYLLLGALPRTNWTRRVPHRVLIGHATPRAGRSRTLCVCSVAVPHRLPPLTVRRGRRRGSVARPPLPSLLLRGGARPPPPPLRCHSEQQLKVSS